MSSDVQAKWMNSDDARELGRRREPLLEPVLDRLDVVVGRALDRLDARGVGDARTPWRPRRASRAPRRRTAALRRSRGSAASASSHATSTRTRCRIRPNSLNCSRSASTLPRSGRRAATARSGGRFRRRSWRLARAIESSTRCYNARPLQPCTPPRVFRAETDRFHDESLRPQGARRARGEEDRVPVVSGAPWDPGNPVHAYNPLGKLPVLILDDGTHLYDSRVIVEYIDLVSPVSRLIPEPARQRIAVKKWEALADGVCDAAAAIVVERRRPTHLQSDEWIDRQRRKIGEGVAELSRELGDRAWCHGESLLAGRHRDGLRARLSRPAPRRARLARALSEPRAPRRQARQARVVRRNGPLGVIPATRVGVPRYSACFSCSRIAGFSSVETSCVIASPLAIERSSRRMILPRARLRQVVAEADVLRLGDRADLLADPVAQLAWRSSCASSPVGRAPLQHDERADRLAGQCRRAGRRRRLRRPVGLRDQRRLDLHRAQAVARRRSARRRCGP